MSPSVLSRLSRRDRRALILGLAVLTVAGVVFGWLSPTLDRIRRLDRAIASETQRLEQVRVLHQAVLELNEREAKVQEQIRRRTAEAFSVASVVEAIARESSVMEQVQYLKPEQARVSDQFREASVSLKMVEITPAQLIDFLYRVESSERILRVRNLQIRVNPKEAGKLDLTLTVFTLLPAGAGTKPLETEATEAAQEPPKQSQQQPNEQGEQPTKQP